MVVGGCEQGVWHFVVGSSASLEFVFLLTMFLLVVDPIFVSSFPFFTALLALLRGSVEVCLADCFRPTGVLEVACHP